MNLPETEGYKRIKKVSINFVNAMKIGDIPGVYGKEPGDGESFYGSYHAAHVLDMFNELDGLSDKDRDIWASNFTKRQTAQGYFSPSPEKAKQRSINELEPVWHYTRGNIWALRILGKKAEKPFRFAEPLLEKGALYKWIKSYDWANSWAAGNQVCAGATVLMAMRDWFDMPEIDKILEREMFPALQELVDPATGYWGTQFGASLYNGNFGTIHVVPMYFAQGWPLPYADKNVNSTLQIQYPDGSFWPCGSNCPDFDGAYMIHNLLKITSYRGDELENAMRLYLSHALMHESKDGTGWLIHRRDSTPGQWKSRPHWIWQDNGKRTVVGEIRDEAPGRKKIMLDSWFYPLSIALAAMSLGNTGYEGPYKLNPMSLHESNVKT